MSNHSTWKFIPFLKSASLIILDRKKEKIEKNVKMDGEVIDLDDYVPVVRPVEKLQKEGVF